MRTGKACDAVIVGFRECSRLPHSPCRAAQGRDKPRLDACRFGCFSLLEQITLLPFAGGKCFMPSHCRCVAGKLRPSGASIRVTALGGVHDSCLLASRLPKLPMKLQVLCVGFVS